MSDQGYVVRERRGSYLEWVPADKRFEWIAGSAEYASVLTLAAATLLAQQRAHLGATVRPDPEKRAPDFGIHDVQMEGAA